jgi:hypothetical protein
LLLQRLVECLYARAIRLIPGNDLFGNDLAEIDGDIFSEPAEGAVVEPYGQHLERNILFPAADGQSCRALFQGAQLPFIDAPPFAEDENDAVPREYLLAIFECLIIAAQVFHSFAHTVYGQDLQARK